MNLRSLGPGLLVTLITACGTNGGPAAGECLGGKCDGLTFVPFNPLGEYVGIVSYGKPATIAGTTVKATVADLDDGDTRSPKVQVKFLEVPNADGPRTIVLRFNNETGDFRGQLTRLCDDPGCLQIDSLDVHLYNTSSAQAMLYYRFAGLRHEGEEPEQRVEEVALLAQQPSSTPQVLTFPAGSTLSQRLMDLANRVVSEDCNTDGITYQATDIETEQDGDEQYFVISLRTSDGQDGFLVTLYEDQNHEIGVVEYDCPEP